MIYRNISGEESNELLLGPCLLPVLPIFRERQVPAVSFFRVFLKSAVLFFMHRICAKFTSPWVLSANFRILCDLYRWIMSNKAVNMLANLLNHLVRSDHIQMQIVFEQALITRKKALLMTLILPLLLLSIFLISSASSPRLTLSFEGARIGDTR